MSRVGQTLKTIGWRFSIATMKFFVSLLICSLGLVGWPSRAQSSAQDMTAEVLGVYFTPPANAAAAIVKAIDTSEREVLVQAYGFTHNAIAQALVRAHVRGVKVRVLLDKKSQTSNRYVIGVLQDADIAVRLDGKHAIAHNKVMVIDQEVVITGSFNFTNSAATRNAENFLILKSPDLALQYRLQWQNHWAHGVDSG
jgi:phosphatidylserine/phosphatidylglycerophosphate/cardiolipin synthase-like enzyme